MEIKKDIGSEIIPYFGRVVFSLAMKQRGILTLYLLTSILISQAESGECRSLHTSEFLTSG